MQTTGGGLVSRRIPLIVALAALAVPSIPAAAHLNSAPRATTCDGKSVAFHRHRARSILKHEYQNGLERHAMPGKEELEGYHVHKLCIRLETVRDQLAELRSTLKDSLEQSIAVTPYPGPNGTWWALPYSVVVCESGANYYVGFGGAYGILVSTWLQWGGGQYGPTAGASPPWAQDIIAHEVWTDVGPSGWACA